MTKPKRGPVKRQPPLRPSSAPPAGGAQKTQAREQAARQAKQAAWQARRRRNRMIAIGAVVAVVAVVGILVGVKLSSGTATAAPREPLPAGVLPKLTSIPLSTLAAAATKVTNLTAPSPLKDSPLTANGKPEILYIGAEFCPVCATERWPLAVALSHFGTFTNLSETHSAVTDGNIPTITFYGSTYSSSELVFRPVEVTTNQRSGNSYQPLETPSQTETSLWVASLGQESFPFIDLAGKFGLATSQFLPTTLEGHSFSDIVSALGNNNNPIGADIDASAYQLVKDICVITGQQPASTCQAVSST